MNRELTPHPTIKSFCEDSVISLFRFSEDSKFHFLSCLDVGVRISRPPLISNRFYQIDVYVDKNTLYL